jgi:hypothetical protein
LFAASGELLNVVFICLTIDYFPGLATARLGGGLSVVMGCGFFATGGAALQLAQPSGYRIRHEDEKKRSAILMRILQNCW